jgi:hypothetical protein
MPRLQAPPEIQIASLRRQKVVDRTDLMAPGPGTVWEDRGSQGFVGAYIKTAGTMLLAPRKSLWQLRRPESTGDARGLLVGTGVMWFLAVMIHAGIHWLRLGDAAPETFWYLQGGVALLALLAPLVLATVGTRVMFSMANQVLRGRAQPALVYNVIAYLFAGTAIVVIPFAGPAVALVWLCVTLVTGSIERLHLKAGDGVVGGILTAFTMALVGGGGYALAVWLVPKLLQLWFGPAAL